MATLGMTVKQITIMSTFVSICHAVIEETIIFTAVSANGVVVLLSRALTALVFGFMYILITTWTTGIKGEQGFSAKEED